MQRDNWRLRWEWPPWTPAPEWRPGTAVGNVLPVTNEPHVKPSSCVCHDKDCYGVRRSGVSAHPCVLEEGCKRPTPILAHSPQPSIPANTIRTRGRDPPYTSRETPIAPRQQRYLFPLCRVPHSNAGVDGQCDEHSGFGRHSGDCGDLLWVTGAQSAGSSAPPCEPARQHKRHSFAIAWFTIRATGTSTRGAQATLQSLPDGP